MSRNKRETGSYLESAKELSRFIPSLKKYKKRKTLKPSEKSAIARKENILRDSYTQLEDLIPVTKKQARELKDLLWQPETLIKTGTRKGQTSRHHFVQALRLRNVGKDTHIIKKIDRNIYVVSNGRTWVYWKLPDTRPKTLLKAGQQLFEEFDGEEPEEFEEREPVKPDEFDIERLIELAKQAFERPETKAVYLWAETGRVGFGMKSLSNFIHWIRQDYASYAQTEKWVNGIAILIADVDEKVSLREFASFSKSREERIEERKRNRAIYRNKRRRKT